MDGETATKAGVASAADDGGEGLESEKPVVANGLVGVDWAAEEDPASHIADTGLANNPLPEKSEVLAVKDGSVGVLSEWGTNARVKKGHNERSTQVRRLFTAAKEQRAEAALAIRESLVVDLEEVRKRSKKLYMDSGDPRQALVMKAITEEQVKLTIGYVPTVVKQEITPSSEEVAIKEELEARRARGELPTTVRWG